MGLKLIWRREVGLGFELFQMDPRGVEARPRRPRPSVVARFQMDPRGVEAQRRRRSGLTTSFRWTLVGLKLVRLGRLVEVILVSDGPSWG